MPRLTRGTAGCPASQSGFTFLINNKNFQIFSPTLKLNEWDSYIPRPCGHFCFKWRPLRPVIEVGGEMPRIAARCFCRAKSHVLLNFILLTVGKLGKSNVTEKNVSAIPRAFSRWLRRENIMASSLFPERSSFSFSQSTTLLPWLWSSLNKQSWIFLINLSPRPKCIYAQN